jgi:hypothetical protein
LKECIYSCGGGNAEDTFPIANFPFVVDPLPALDFAIINSKVFEVRSPIGTFKDEWNVILGGLALIS